jgi:hypothetical protein
MRLRCELGTVQLFDYLTDVIASLLNQHLGGVDINLRRKEYHPSLLMKKNGLPVHHHLQGS